MIGIQLYEFVNSWWFTDFVLMGFSISDPLNLISIFDPVNVAPGIILYVYPANEGQRYSVTSSLIGWAHTKNDPCSI